MRPGLNKNRAFRAWARALFMCFCAAALPCTTCFFRSRCDAACCECFNEECTVTDSLAQEDCSYLCCCLEEEFRLGLCDPFQWFLWACCVKVDTEPPPPAAALPAVQVMP